MLKKFLIMFSLITAFNLMGKDINQERENEVSGVRYSDYEPVNDDKHVDVNQNQNSSKKKKGTKAASDYDHLIGFSLNSATFELYEDQMNYMYYIGFKVEIVQGLTIDKNGYFLITAYSEGNPTILIKYDSINNVIKKVYDIGNSGHAGGIGYTYKNYTEGTKEFVVISRGKGVDIFLITNTSLTLLFHQSISIQASYLSISNSYLWVGRFGEDEDGNDPNQPLHGYQINHHKFINGLNQTKYMITLGKPITDSNNSIKNSYLINKVNNTYPSENFNITVPKPNIQGVYCVSNPYFEKRLRFYFSASNNHTFVYQGILDTNDLNSDGIINGIGGNENYSSYPTTREWAWETFFTPYAQFGTSLPDGGEGLVIKNGQLYMLNEGSAKTYCEKWDWPGSDPIDCARELLKIDNLKNGTRVFDNGSITINGSGINNFGTKVILVIAQNKMGEFYYSMGELNKTDGYSYMGNIPIYQPVLTTYLVKPDYINPFNYNNPVVKRPKVYVEDIKGLYIMNLPSATNQNDSDDWTFTKLRVTMDDIYSLQSPTNYTLNNLYDLRFEESDFEFGDNNINSSTGDKQGMFFAFNSFVGEDDPFGNRYINQSLNYLNLKEVYNKMKTCYASYGSDCLYKDIIGSNTDFYTYFENDVVCNLIYSSILNYSYMGRKTSIKGSYICE